MCPPRPCSLAADPSYARIIAALGPSLLDVLNGGLSGVFHQHLDGAQDPSMMSMSLIPELSIENVGAESAELHCSCSSGSVSGRGGGMPMRHFTEGNVTAVARLFFGIDDIGLEYLPSSAAPGERGPPIPGGTPGKTEPPLPLGGGISGSGGGDSHHEVYRLTLPRQELGTFLAAREQLRAAASACTYAPSPSLFYRTFPFHFILDKGCRLIQVWGEIST